MRYHNPLNHILNSKAKIVCLRFMCTTPAEMNGTQLAKLIGISTPTAHRTMKELFEERVVIMRTIGNNHLYELDRSNSIVTQVLVPMFKEERHMVEILFENIKELITSSPCQEGIVTVALFGSVEEKMEGPGSDIDLLVVIKDHKNAKEIEDIFFDSKSRILKKIPTRIEPYIKTVPQLIKEKDQGVIKGILKSHTIIYGKKLEEIIWSQKG